MSASKITVKFSFLVTSHGFLFLYILVIVYVNLTSNAVIFKRHSKGLYTSILIHLGNDYRPYSIIILTGIKHSLLHNE